jgi:hypothetical protein
MCFSLTCVVTLYLSHCNEIAAKVWTISELHNILKGNFTKMRHKSRKSSKIVNFCSVFLVYSIKMHYLCTVIQKKDSHNIKIVTK